MAREFTEVEAHQHNALTSKGWSLIEKEIILHERGNTLPPDKRVQQQLQQAVQCFEQALQINPDGWPSMYALGKIYQRLGDSTTAFRWFSRAHAINPTQIDVAREAGLVALDIGLIDEAIALCEAAYNLSPNDLGLLCNLALAYCLAGRDSEAQQCATTATTQEPGDAISQNVLRFVRAVANGNRPRPKRLLDVFSNA